MTINSRNSIIFFGRSVGFAHLSFWCWVALKVRMSLEHCWNDTESGGRNVWKNTLVPVPLRSPNIRYWLDSDRNVLPLYWPTTNWLITKWPLKTDAYLSRAIARTHTHTRTYSICTSQITQLLSAIKTSRLIFKKLIDIYSENSTKYININCEQNQKFLNVTVGGTGLCKQLLSIFMLHSY